MFLKFTLINPQTGKPEDQAYVDSVMVSSWQSMRTKYDKPCTLINLKSGMGVAYMVDETFHSASARILKAHNQDSQASVEENEFRNEQREKSPLVS